MHHPILGSTHVLPFIFALFLYLSSCENGEEDSPTVLITGRWELDDWSGDEILDPNDYEAFEFDFEENGDFRWRLLPDNSTAGYFLSGEWDLNSDQTELEIVIEIGGGDEIVFEMDIDLLTSDRLELDGTIAYGTDNLDAQIEFDKIR